jgi:cytidine deaminase
MPPSDAQLVQAALDASRRAHAPYSRYPVGAALLAADGSVVTGCNVENASYGLTLCAERVALVSAAAAGNRRFVRLAVVAGASRPAWPCGACLQVLAEFCGPDLQILMAPRRGPGRIRRTTLGALLPQRFALRHAPPRRRRPAHSAS